jgi:hypothetical protein
MRSSNLFKGFVSFQGWNLGSLAVGDVSTGSGQSGCLLNVRSEYFQQGLFSLKFNCTFTQEYTGEVLF